MSVLVLIPNFTFVLSPSRIISLCCFIFLLYVVVVFVGVSVFVCVIIFSFLLFFFSPSFGVMVPSPPSLPSSFLAQSKNDDNQRCSMPPSHSDPNKANISKKNFMWKRSKVSKKRISNHNFSIFQNKQIIQPCFFNVSFNFVDFSKMLAGQTALDEADWCLQSFICEENKLMKKFNIVKKSIIDWDTSLVMLEIKLQRATMRPIRPLNYIRRSIQSFT